MFKFNQRCPNLDAIFVGSDILAAGNIFEAQRNGINIPEDLSIVGSMTLKYQEQFAINNNS